MFTLNALRLYLSNRNYITSLNYLENKVNSLFNQSQEMTKKRKKKNALRNLFNKFYLERNNADKLGERISNSSPGFVTYRLLSEQKPQE